VRLLGDGTVEMMLPQGSRQDPRARIYPFKLHRGLMPVMEGTNFLIPIVVEEFFADGNIDKAVKAAAAEMYGVKNANYRWVPTTHYMGIFHEVVPKEQALSCWDCHSPKGRRDWKALGYEGDPLLRRLVIAHQ
jgi:hypothetical protein